MTSEQKIKYYEEFLHRIQIMAEVTKDDVGLRQLIENACDWSYGHRSGNGQLSDDDQQQKIENLTKRLIGVTK